MIKMKKYFTVALVGIIMVSSMAACQNANQVTDETTTLETEVMQK